MSVLKDYIERHKEPKIYPLLAKFGLWLVSLTLFIIMIHCWTDILFGNNWQHIGTAIQACQALSLICITVLGYHGYRGHRIFHELRHWKD
jgi:hypothetical protein